MLDRAAPIASKGSSEELDLDLANVKSHIALSRDSANGSPPMTVCLGMQQSTTRSTNSDYYPTNERPHNNASPPPLPHSPSEPGQHREQPTSHPASRGAQRGGTRTASKSGGVQVVLEETVYWKPGKRWWEK